MTAVMQAASAFEPTQVSDLSRVIPPNRTTYTATDLLHSAYTTVCTKPKHSRYPRNSGDRHDTIR